MMVNCFSRCYMEAPETNHGAAGGELRRLKYSPRVRVDVEVFLICTDVVADAQTRRAGAPTSALSRDDKRVVTSNATKLQTSMELQAV